MTKLLWTALLTSMALAAPAGAEMRSYAVVAGKTQGALAWCDAPGAVIALTTPQQGRATLSVQDKGKGQLGPVHSFPATLGDPEPGAGQVYVPLSWKNGAATVQGFLHTSNVENVNDPAYRMTHVNEFRLSDVTHRCRYVPQAAFFGVTSKRTVIVWENGKTSTYATRNFDGTPGVWIQGEPMAHGVITRDADSGRVVGFQRVSLWPAPGGYRYQLEVTEEGATLKVMRNNRTLQIEPLLAYSVSLPRTSEH
ncbi:hypothetical protein [Deinococcus hohokamensis]|uniref:DUF4198 domain-containing protein n=1 Tax=Deinococcus hohokamensis TaxID=309883 RepID=A0ABV9IAI2_9DEIO